MFYDNTANGVTVRAYRGDTMTLLAFDIEDSLMTDTFVGFTIGVKTPGGARYFLLNRLNFEGSDKELPSDQAPFQKFRWIHVAGLHHQELNNPEFGTYTYTVTPRYWNPGKDALLPIDSSLSVEVDVELDHFAYKNLGLGFARSFLTSQAYQRWFGAKNTNFTPDKWWTMDTGRHFCTNNGKSYTYEDVYTWLGYTARKETLDLLSDILADKDKSADIFAYDFNEPRVIRLCLNLAKDGRLRMILDNSTSTVTDKKTGEKKVTGHGAPDSPETWFANEFNAVKTGDSAIWRGKFSRFAHDKVIIVKEGGRPVKVLTGSTNFSVTGYCINANHIAIYDNAATAELYKEVFDTCFGQKSMTTAFKKSPYSKNRYEPGQGTVPDTSVTFAPHEEAFAAEILDDIAAMIREPGGGEPLSSVLFSVMDIGTSPSSGSVYPALMEVQKNESIFSAGVTDSRSAISLYKPGSRKGILVDAKDLQKSLPPPFNAEASFNAHNIHHKFVVINFNRSNARVYFGSSNLALGGEKSNGDNLLCVCDPEIATAFAIEAIRLVDHYQFRAKKEYALAGGNALKLDKDSTWARPYFDENDFKYLDRKLFAS